MVRFVRQNWGVFFLVMVALTYLAVYSVTAFRAKPQLTRLYFADRLTDAHRILIAEYNRRHADRVEVVPVDFPNTVFTTNDRKEIFTRSLRGEGDVIDVLAVDVIWVQRFAKWCIPLNDYFSKKDLAQIIDAALYSCYSDTTLVAIPLNFVQGILYYREDLVRARPGGDALIRLLEQGMTWEEFIAEGRRFPSKRDFYVFPAADYEGLMCDYVELLLSQRNDYFRQEGFRFNTPEARRALQILTDFVQTYRLAPPSVTSMTEVSSYEYFIRNDGLFLRGWTSYDRDFADPPYDSLRQSRLRSAPLPYMAGGKPASAFGGWNLMVPKHSSHKEEALEFIKFLLEPSSQELFHTRAGYNPVLKIFYEDSGLAERIPSLVQARRLLETRVHRPPMEHYTKYSKLLTEQLVQAIDGSISVEGALARATRAIAAEPHYSDRR